MINSVRHRNNIMTVYFTLLQQKAELTSDIT